VNDDHHDGADDSDLLSRLQAADPAASLRPTDPVRVTHLLEAAMTDTSTYTTESRESGTHDRSPLTWLVAAAAVVLIAAGAVFGLANRDHDQVPAAQHTVTTLGVASSTGRCIVPDVGVLRTQTIAFRGTLTSLEGGDATFRVGHWFRGGPTDLAKVSTTPAALRPLAESASFSVGGTYLLAAQGGMVTGCGFSGPATGHLAHLYALAYGG
jgi:hypothetical protein